MATEKTNVSRRGRRRQGGRSANTRRTAAAVTQMPWELPRNSDVPTEPLAEDAVHAVHDGAMRVLEEIGIEFLSDEAKQILAKAGCTVSPDSDNVRLDRDFVMEQVKKSTGRVRHYAEKLKEEGYRRW